MTAGCPPREYMPWLDPTSLLPSYRTVGRSSRTQATSSGTSASTRVRSPSRAASAARPSLTRRPARPTRRPIGTSPSAPGCLPLSTPGLWKPRKSPCPVASHRQPAEAIQLRGVWQELPTHQPAEPAQEAALRRGALPLRGLWQAVHHLGQPQEAPARAQW